MKYISYITRGIYTNTEDVSDEFMSLIMSGVSVDDLLLFLKKNKGNTIMLYHGSGISNHEGIIENGIKKTKISSKKSLQSSIGYTYFSLYEEHSRLFGSIAYPFDKHVIVYRVKLPISQLKPDNDQLFNAKVYDINLATSFIYGSGCRIAGDVPRYMIVDYKKLPK